MYYIFNLIRIFILVADIVALQQFSKQTLKNRRYVGESLHIRRGRILACDLEKIVENKALLYCSFLLARFFFYFQYQLTLDQTISVHSFGANIRTKVALILSLAFR